MISGAATAALVELDPHGSRRRAALGAGLAQAGGSALGPLVAGVLAQWAPDPLQLSYLATLGLTLVAATFVLRLPERGEGSREVWRPQWPRVPAERSAFLRVGLTAGVVWATLALFLSIVPPFAEALLRTRNLALVAAIAALALVASFGAQAVAVRRRGSHRRDQALGCFLLALGLAGLVGAAPTGSLALLVAAALVAGIGHGIAFLTAQQELNELAPDEHRGEVTAAFIACIYLLVATFVVASGLLGSIYSLAVSVEVVGAVLIAAALASATWQIAGATRRNAAAERRATAPRTTAARR